MESCLHDFQIFNKFLYAPDLLFLKRVRDDNSQEITVFLHQKITVQYCYNIFLMIPQWFLNSVNVIDSAEAS